MSYARICDISVYQPDIDWPRLKELGIGIIARAGQNFWHDPLWDEHYAGARAAGVPIGMYWFWQPDQPSQQQIDGFLNVWKNLPWKPRVIALDVEGIEYLENGEWKLVTPPSIAFHNYHLWQWLTMVEEETGVLPLIYTAQSYWNAWTDPAYDWDHFPLWVANWLVYSPDAIRYPRDWNAWQIWQYEGGTGRQEGISGPVDLDYFNGTTEQMYAYFGMDGGQTMTTLYKTTVKQTERAKILTYNPDQKIQVSPDLLGVDGVILRMGGMESTEATFPGRFELFKNYMPVLGRFDLDAGWWLKNQHTANEVQGMQLTSNYILAHLVDAWHDGNWTWADIMAGHGKWRKVSALILSMVETDGFPAGTQVNDFWQALTFTHIANHVRYLIDNGFAPDIPVILYTGPWFLQLYPTNLALEIANRKSWLYLHLGQWTLTSTATFNNLGEIFAFRPAETFNFQYVPDGYFERIYLHEYTGEAQKCVTVTDAAGNPSKVNLSLWQDTVEGMYDELGWTAPQIPPVDDLKARIEALETNLKALTAAFNELTLWAYNVEIKPFQGPG